VRHPGDSETSVTGPGGRQPPRVISGSRRIRRGPLLWGVWFVACLTGLLLIPTGATLAAVAGGASAPTGAPLAPDTGTNALPCYSIAPTVCISMQNTSTPSIIPQVGSFAASTEPAANRSFTIVVKSRTPLNYTENPVSGPLSVIALNVTANLWNGNPFYTPISGNVWHANNATGTWWWCGSKGCQVQNGSYPWWYYVSFDAATTAGTPNFVPGMHVNWWLSFETFNGTTKVAWTSPTFSFTFAGAWPFSPYPGSIQYAGPAAAAEDVTPTVTPASPNWDDSITATLNTTASDGAPVNATIGSAYWVVSEVNPNGTLLNASTIAFPGLSPPGTIVGAGKMTVTVTLPAVWAQVPGSTVTYWFLIFDTADDEIRTPTQSYVVGGNGTFDTNVFADDLGLSGTPPGLFNGTNSTLNLGEPVGLTLQSLDPHTSILAAEAVVTFTYPALGETVHAAIPLHRNYSTYFTGEIPAFPMGSEVSFVVEAWDFNQSMESSAPIAFTVPTLQDLLPQIPGNSTFFYLFVYDNGSHQWVSGAEISIIGPSGYLRIDTSTLYGVAYPNVSGAALVPVVLPANATYQVTINDPSWQTGAAHFNNTITLALPLVHALKARGPVAVGSDYTVLLEGDAIMFFLNATPAAAPNSPPAITDQVELPAIVALIAGFAIVVPLLLWWRRIELRRKADARRITL
jgi:hypothetical protein